MQVRPQLDERSFPQVIDGATFGVPEQVSGIDDLDILTPLGDVGDDESGLGKVRAARRIADDPSGSSGLDRRDEQRPLQGAELDEIRGRAGPALPPPATTGEVLRRPGAAPGPRTYRDVPPKRPWRQRCR